MEFVREFAVLTCGGAFGYIGYYFSKNSARARRQHSEVNAPLFDLTLASFQPKPQICTLHGYLEKREEKREEKDDYIIIKEEKENGTTVKVSTKNIIIHGTLENELKDINELLDERYINKNEKELFIYGKLELNDGVLVLNEVNSNKAVMIANSEEEIYNYNREKYITTRRRELNISFIFSICSLLSSYFCYAYIPKRRKITEGPYSITIKEYKDLYTEIEEIHIQYRKNKEHPMSPLLYRNEVYKLLFERKIITSNQFINEEIMDSNSITIRLFKSRKSNLLYYNLRRIIQVFGITGFTLAFFSIIDYLS